MAKVTVESAIKAGLAARKRDERAKRVALETREWEQKQEAAAHRSRLRKKWIDSGVIFDRVQEAVRKGESEFHIGEADGACAELASMLNEIVGLNVSYYTFRMRMADDCPEEDIGAVKVTWSSGSR